METINTKINRYSVEIAMYVPFYEQNSAHIIDDFYSHNAIHKNCAMTYYTTISVSLS